MSVILNFWKSAVDEDSLRFVPRALRQSA